MAHNIAQINGSYAVFVAGQAAWHKLGINVTEAQTWADAQRLAGLDFTLADEPLRTDYQVLTDWKAIIRTDNMQTIGVVGKDFTTVQPHDAFQFVDTLIESHGAHYVSAGMLGNGERMWVLARIPAADIEVTPGDVSETYMLFAQGFDGSLSVLSKVTSTRVVCQNTLFAAIADKNFSLKLRHTKTVNDRLKSAEKLLSGVSQTAHQLEEKLRKLAARRLTRETMTSIMDRLFPKPADEKQPSTRRENIVSDVMSVYESNDKNAFPVQRGTAYNLLNAITDYTDHLRSSRSNGNGADWHRAESAMFGSGANLKQQAVDVIYELTNGLTETRTVYTMPIAPSSPGVGGSFLDQVVANTNLP